MFNLIKGFDYNPQFVYWAILHRCRLYLILPDWNLLCVIKPQCQGSSDQFVMSHHTISNVTDVKFHSKVSEEGSGVTVMKRPYQQMVVLQKNTQTFYDLKDGAYLPISGQNRQFYPTQMSNANDEQCIDGRYQTSTFISNDQDDPHVRVDITDVKYNQVVHQMRIRTQLIPIKAIVKIA